MERPQKHKSAAEIESDLRSGRYPSYAVACAALSRSRLLTPEKKEELKRLALDLSKTRSSSPQPQPQPQPQPVMSVWTSSQGDAPPSDSSSTSFGSIATSGNSLSDGSLARSLTSSRSLLDRARPEYESLRQCREHIAAELERLDAELAAYPDERMQDLVARSAKAAMESVLASVSHGWDSVKAIGPDAAASALSKTDWGALSQDGASASLLLMALLVGLRNRGPDAP